MAENMTTTDLEQQRKKATQRKTIYLIAAVAWWLLLPGSGYVFARGFVPAKITLSFKAFCNYFYFASQGVQWGLALIMFAIVAFTVVKYKDFWGLLVGIFAGATFITVLAYVFDRIDKVLKFMLGERYERMEETVVPGLCESQLQLVHFMILFGLPLIILVLQAIRYSCKEKKLLEKVKKSSEMTPNIV